MASAVRLLLHVPLPVPLLLLLLVVQQRPRTRRLPERRSRRDGVVWGGGGSPRGGVRVMAAAYVQRRSMRSWPASCGRKAGGGVSAFAFSSSSSKSALAPGGAAAAAAACAPTGAPTESTTPGGRTGGGVGTEPTTPHTAAGGGGGPTGRTAAAVVTTSLGGPFKTERLYSDSLIAALAGLLTTLVAATEGRPRARVGRAWPHILRYLGDTLRRFRAFHLRQQRQAWGGEEEEEETEDQSEGSSVYELLVHPFDDIHGGRPQEETGSLSSRFQLPGMDGPGW
eukprot:GHVU01181510.1.p1 GENE.GHVU01181510.1~~GHVU01181510.1.p1  ORF type:complete len:295 (-),score=61.86 GHVU01181510.1:849-1694(-)